MRKMFFEDDLKVLLGWLGIDYKKAIKNRVRKTIVLFLLVVVLGFLLKNVYIIFSSLLVSIIYYKLQYYFIKNERNKTVDLKRKMFPSFIKKLLILLRTNNIYISLNKLLEFTDDPIKKHLKELISDIDNDKSIEPYIKFANNMEFIEVYQVMIMLYTFFEKSMSETHLISLENMITQLYENEVEDVIESKKRLMWMYPNFVILSMLVLIFSIAIFMLLDILKGVSFT